MLWFAWKQLPLQYQQQLRQYVAKFPSRCDLLENNYLCSISNNLVTSGILVVPLWFAWKQLPLQYQQQPLLSGGTQGSVVICLKTTTFAVSATTAALESQLAEMLWFAWKQLPLQYQQQLIIYIILITNTIYRYCKNKKVILQNKIPLAKGGIFVFYQLKIRTVPAADREH